MPEQNNKKKSKEIIPPLEFQSLILPFYTQALVKMGQFANPVSQKTEENLELAKRLIDLLDLLQNKTKGNLKEKEKIILTDLIQQLKNIYLKKTSFQN